MLLQWIRHRWAEFQTRKARAERLAILMNRFHEAMGEARAELEGDVPVHLVRLLEIEKKGELYKYCKSLVVTAEDFTRLVVNCARIGYQHQIMNRDFIPKHLALTEEDLVALRSVKAEQELSGTAAKAARKVRQTFRDRRFFVAHRFYKEGKWHIFFFTQKDIEDNHWKIGSHVHFVNYLWPQYDQTRLWDVLNNSGEAAGGSLHIRFIYRTEPLAAYARSV